MSYSACNMAFMAYGVGLTKSIHAGSKNFPFRIDVLTSSPPSSFVLRYAVVTCRHSKNRPPSLPSPQSNLTCSELIDSLVPAKPPLQTVFLIPNPLLFLFASDGALSSLFTSNFPILPGRLTRSIMLRQLIPKGPAMPLRQYIQTARPWRYPVKIYVDEIHNLGSYESILP